MNVNDYQNILALLTRVPITGLPEAQALVVLGVKIEAEITRLSKPPVDKDVAEKKDSKKKD